MIIVKLQGGLGNQMFQYAFGRNLAVKKNTKLKMDVTSYNKKDILALQNDTKRVFLLNVFNINTEIASIREAQTYNPFLYRVFKKIKNKLFGFKNHYIFNQKEFDVNENSYIEGFWQSEKYFNDIKEVVQKEFNLKIPLSNEAMKVQQQISESNISVSLHVRRGDYINQSRNSNFASVCSKEYYEAAFNEISKKNVGEQIYLFIFSDDIQWTKDHLVFHCPTYFVSDSTIKEYEEMILMSNCTHHIIANSTFSWWGAWLNPNPEKIVIAPKKWLSDDRVDTKDIIPESWIQL